ncbi:Flp family type IVb pilin [Helcococcus ovis]|uniref:Flp family type IVb pilin n=1 Tax=Helcococcus ovis TaxID=72026 RepID=UPI0038BB6C74
MKNIMNWFMKEESGQGMVEYGLILALIAVVVIAALTSVGTKIKGIFQNIAGNLNSQVR